MMFNLFPFINPINLLTNGISLAYLASWPFIIQNLGQDVLLSQSFILILLMVICDFARQIMVRRIGFDFLSVPVGIAVLAGLNTAPGVAFLTLTKPIYSTILILIKPILIIVETYSLMEIIRKLNQWISKQANKRDSTLRDPYSWEEPLTRGALLARVLVIMTTISCYVGTYFIIVMSQHNLYKSTGTVPAIFEQAIIGLITLQFLAGTTTVLKEEGIISETALICLTSSISIFIASLHQSQVLTSALLESGLVAVFLMMFSNIFSSTNGEYDGRRGRRHHSSHSLISKQTLIKIILLLSYTQMLVQQEKQSQAHRSSGIPLVPFGVGGSGSGWSFFETSPKSSSGLFGSFWKSPEQAALEASSVFFTVGGVGGAGRSLAGSAFDLAGVIFTNFLSGFSGFGGTYDGAQSSIDLYSGPLWTWQAFDRLWLGQLGSTTIQRLLQSFCIQIIYIISLIFARDEEEEDSRVKEDDSDSEY